MDQINIKLDEINQKLTEINKTINIIYMSDSYKLIKKLKEEKKKRLLNKFVYSSSSEEITDDKICDCGLIECYNEKL